MKKKNNKNSKENISRKAALKKMGYGAFTAGTMMFLLNNPAKGQGGDFPSMVPEWEW